MTKPPQPEELVRHIRKNKPNYAPAIIAEIDRWSAEIAEDAAALGVDITSRDWAAAWVIAGGALAKLLSSANWPSDQVERAADVYWAVGLWRLSEMTLFGEPLPGEQREPAPG